MIVFPVLCIAMFRHFLDSPLKHLWINSFWCLWCDTNSFLACSLSTFLYGILSIHVHFDYVCVCASMCGLGGGVYGLVPAMYCDFNIWMGSGHLCMTLVSCLCWFGGIRWRKVVRRGRYLVFCVCDVYHCSQQRAGVCCCIVQSDSMHARICSAHSLQLYSVSCWTSLSGVSSCYILHIYADVCVTCMSLCVLDYGG